MSGGQLEHPGHGLEPVGQERTGVARPPASSVVAMACNVARRSFRRISSRSIALSTLDASMTTPGGVVGVSI